MSGDCCTGIMSTSIAEYAGQLSVKGTIKNGFKIYTSYTSSKLYEII
jgi:hypothetical protein